MKIVKLGDLVEFQRGYDLPKNKIQNGKYPVITSNGVLGYHNEYKSGPSVVIGRSGTIGNPQFINEKFWAHNTTLFIKDFKGNDIKYIYYLLLNTDINKMKSGSNIPTLNRNHLHPISVNATTDKILQRKIANTLSNIDNKIELNNKINDELESMAKTIYDYWFLKFEFPNEKGKPYKSSGGKMVFNEELKRAIPEGWEVNKLGKICITLLGGTPDTKNEKFWNGNIPWLNSGEVAAVSPIIKSEKTITEQAMNNSSTSFAKSGTVLISITRYIVPSILAIDSCFNQSVVAILPNNLYHTAFLYPFMKSQVNRYMSLRIGAQQPHINKQIIDDTNICIPPIDILNKYYLITEKLYKLQMKFAKENQELTSLRDFLLPLLMNGQVGFKEDKAEG